MPRSSAWFIRASLAYLALGFTLGAFMLANKGLALTGGLERFLAAHAEILLAGWLVQVALGVAYWILPRYTRGLPRGNQALAWFSLVSLNAGIMLAAVGEVFNIAWFVLPGRVLEAASVLAFLVVAWGRVRPSG